eukprot:Selendium_serpulae@DN1107_c0_g1_i1.p1
MGNIPSLECISDPADRGRPQDRLGCFWLDHMEDGRTYEIAPRHQPHLRLSVAPPGRGSERFVELRESDGSGGQRFTARRRENTKWSFSSILDAACRLDDSWVWTRATTGLIVKPASSEDETKRFQQFDIRPLGVDGCWFIISSSSDAACVWDVNARGGEGARVVSVPLHFGDNQQFKFLQVVAVTG